MKLKLETEPLTWKQAALIFGEIIGTNGPNNYYNFTPKEWLNWATKNLTNEKTYVTIIEH